MRKFSQLFLVLIASVSLVLLLIYRHEYNRLHYVLEVFSFFGQPCNFTDILSANTVLADRRIDWGVVPQWQQYEDISFYSGYWQQNEARVIVTKTGEIRNSIPSCYLWYDSPGDKAVLARFSYTQIGHETMTSAYTFSCRPLNSEEKVPYAVSFYNKDNLKVLLNEISDRTEPVFNTTICVAPSRHMTKRAFVEFLSFHHLLGIDAFIFYTSDLSHKLTRFVVNFSTRLGIDTTFYPWNHPRVHNFLNRQVVEADCNYRAQPYSKYVITLDVNEYIVPTVASSIKAVFDEHGTKSHRLSLPVQDICISSLDQKRPLALQNSGVSYNDENHVRTVFKSLERNDNIISTETIENNFASIFKYDNCSVPERKYSDNNMQRFSTDFVRATLYQLWLNNEI